VKVRFSSLLFKCDTPTTVLQDFIHPREGPLLKKAELAVVAALAATYPQGQPEERGFFY
jgi:hypothetical protein